MANPALDKLRQAKNDPTKFQQALTEAKSSGLDQATVSKLQQAKDDPQRIEQILSEADQK